MAMNILIYSLAGIRPQHPGGGSASGVYKYMTYSYKSEKNGIKYFFTTNAPIMHG